MLASFFRLRLYVLISASALFCTAIPSSAEECVDCHADVAAMMKAGSHHVQLTGLNGRHCYACHWEAGPDGEIDKRYHTGQSSPATPATVDLVVWEPGKRPAEYTSGTTAVTFIPADIATAKERDAVGQISRHCLGCHNDQNNGTLPFAGDPNTPHRYSWDGQSIASRYADTGVTTWGKYSTTATNKKMRVTKAYSAHGNASANQGGWSSGSGYDGEITLTRGGTGAGNVACFDCHNSHGSGIAGITTSYRTADGSNNGGILKQTGIDKSGYRMNYTPSANLNQKSSNPYNPGAGLCFDCHETAKSGATPWGYQSTYGAKEPIMGYKDTAHFGTGTKGSTSRYANRQGRTEIISSHLKGGKFLASSTQEKINGLCTPCHDPHGVSRTLGDRMAYAVPLLKGTWLTSPYREDGPPAASPGKAANSSPGQVNYNTVNREAGANFGKGESVAARQADYNTVNREANTNFGKDSSSSPRQGEFNAVNREASANFGKGESVAARQADYNTVNREANANFGKDSSSSPRQGEFNAVNREASANFGKNGKATDSNLTNRGAGANFGRGSSAAPREPMAGMQYNVDSNTFGGGTRIKENADIFAGLCLSCHALESFSVNTKANRIHRTVKGWGNNKEHAFPCSKCHQAHNSGLPRLMQTNCFQDGPSGLRENSGVPWLPFTSDATTAQGTGEASRDQNGSSSKSKVVGCHVRQFGKAAPKSSKSGGESGEWNKVTTW